MHRAMIYRTRRHGGKSGFVTHFLWVPGNRTIMAAGYLVPKLPVDAQHSTKCA